MLENMNQPEKQATLPRYLILGTIIRLCLMQSRYQKYIMDRYEISTPINSWKRISEALFLTDNKINPYSSSLFHELPLTFMVYKSYVDLFTEKYIFVMFIIFDAVTPILIYLSVRLYLVRSYCQQQKLFETITQMQSEERQTFEFFRKTEIFLQVVDIDNYPKYCYMFYIFNPFCILNCVGQTTTVFTNFMKACFLYGISSRSSIVAVCYLSLAIVYEMYSVNLIVPLLITFAYKNNKINFLNLLKILLLITILVATLLYPSKIIAYNWTFLDPVYKFVLQVGDLRPNVGVFWYFFQEMFDHFRPLFIVAYQLNALFLYVFPLGLKLYKDPFLFSLILIALNTIFSPYPCVGHMGFYLSILLAWTNYLSYLHQGFIIVCLIITAFPSGAVLSYQWLVTNSANANFYFATTSIAICAQIFLIVDLLFSYTKREFWIHNKFKGFHAFKKMKLHLDQ